MLRIAILTARSRLGLFAGALLAFFASAVLVMAGAMLLQAALNTHAPLERYAGAAAVVTGPQRYGTDHDVVLDQPPRVNSALVTRLAAGPPGGPAVRGGGRPPPPPAPARQLGAGDAACGGSRCARGDRRGVRSRSPRPASRRGPWLGQFAAHSLRADRWPRSGATR